MKFLLGLILSIALASAQLDFQLNDIATLNYALTLEHLEYAFYRDGLNTFSDSDFQSIGLNSSVYAYFGLIRDHENAHVVALTSAVRARGGVAAQECTYNFPFLATRNVSAFVLTAQLLENTGVSAYDGAIDTLTELGLQTIAATVATVEGRHAAYLNQLVGTSPFPNSFDVALSPSAVIAAASGFFNSCASAPSLPVQAQFPLNLDFNTTIANANDVNTLNFALFLEDLENNFYLQGLAAFNVSAFAAQGYNQSVYDYIGLISAHETAHVNFLRGNLGSAAIGICSYNFGLSTVSDFLAKAAAFETTGVSAYDGAVNAITNLGYRTAAATIATVEARHSSILNLINQQVPFPANFDTALTPTQIVSIVRSYVTSCPSGSIPPSPLPVPANFSSAARIGGSISTTGGVPTTGAPAVATSGVAVATTGADVTTGSVPVVVTTGSVVGVTTVTVPVVVTTGSVPVVATTGVEPAVATSGSRITTGLQATTSRRVTTGTGSSTQAAVITTASSASMTAFSAAICVFMALMAL